MIQITPRQHLINIGHTIIAEKGFSNVGINEILQTANISKGSFYHYFKSKELFGQALLENYFENYLKNLDGLFQNKQHNAAFRFMSYWEQWAQQECQNHLSQRCLTVKLTAEVSDLSEGMRATLKMGSIRVIERYTTIIHQGIKDGSLTPTLPSEHISLVLYEIWLGASLVTKIRRDRTAMDVALLVTKQLLQIKTN